MFSALLKGLIGLIFVLTGKEVFKIPGFFRKRKLRKKVEKLLARNREIDYYISAEKRSFRLSNIFDFRGRKSSRRLITSLKKEKKENLREIQDFEQLLSLSA